METPSTDRKMPIRALLAIIGATILILLWFIAVSVISSWRLSQGYDRIARECTEAALTNRPPDTVIPGKWVGKLKTAPTVQHAMTRQECQRAKQEMDDNDQLMLLLLLQ